MTNDEKPKEKSGEKLSANDDGHFTDNISIYTNELTSNKGIDNDSFVNEKEIQSIKF